MSLFMNHEHHPTLYKNEHAATSNQKLARINSLTKLKSDQEAAAQLVLAALSALQETQTTNHASLQHEMHGIREGQQLSTAAITQQLQHLQEKNATLQHALEQERAATNALLEEIGALRQNSESMAEQLEQERAATKTMAEDIHALKSDITEQLAKHETANEKLSAQLSEQLTMHEKTAQFQETVLQRLDQQEALTEKMSRQLQHIRSILFERTNYLAAKIEDGYKLTSAYVYKLMTGSDKPLTFSILNRGKEKQSDTE
ncbi:hypothetical protein [Ectobacillus ponti]|uniref:Uncharacterized protein n=1 Tax=Ectobacillus ponti TaxID=2961894 RepID=A0AA41XBP6_9BACI|nr:hypothetical protein [Ectobacillus ponti]MCP8970020.1 hypothetical protein [Ectobacillus ponti]